MKPEETEQSRQGFRAVLRSEQIGIRTTVESSLCFRTLQSLSRSRTTADYALQILTQLLARRSSRISLLLTSVTPFGLRFLFLPKRSDPRNGLVFLLLAPSSPLLALLFARAMHAKTYRAPSQGERVKEANDRYLRESERRRVDVRAAQLFLSLQLTYSTNLNQRLVIPFPACRLSSTKKRGFEKRTNSNGTCSSIPEEEEPSKYLTVP
jgi:hypothetical protein